MYIEIPFYETYAYFLENMYPYGPHVKFRTLEESSLESREWGAWFDKWLDWLVGSECHRRNDTEYLYPWHVKSVAKLLIFGIPYRIVDEHGNEVK